MVNYKDEYRKLEKMSKSDVKRIAKTGKGIRAVAAADVLEDEAVGRALRKRGGNRWPF